MLKSVSVIVSFTAALLLPLMVLVESIREAKRSWGYITTDGQRIYG